MKLLKQAMAVLGTVVVITIIAALVTPKTAHAIVSTMVQVVNTTANPASTLDADTATRTPYQVTMSHVCSSTPCTFTFPAAPAGTRLIIENVSVDIVTSNASPPIIQMQNFGQGTILSFTGPVGPQKALGVYSAINSFTRVIYDPSDGGPFLDATANAYAAGFDGYFTLTGYTINCAVAGCPPVTR